MTETSKTKLSRREFLRLAGLGVGAAAATTAARPAAATGKPTAVKFSDPAGRPQRPWWVKTVDVPTTEVDWGKMKRYNERYLPEEQEGSTRGVGFAGYVGKEKAEAIEAEGAAKMKERLVNNVDGYTLKDIALQSGMNGMRLPYSYLGPQKAKTPEDLGVPKWSGTPEEAAKMVRAALRHMGAATIGFLELDENTKKFVYDVDPDGHIVEFTDDPIASETETHRYIPNSCKYAIVFTVPMSLEAMKRSPTVTGSQTTALTYTTGTWINNGMSEFLRGLGYQCLTESTLNALAIAPALGVFAGLGEMSRLNRMISPEYGPMVRVFKMLTDLPLAPDKPIDAGIMEFCKTCKKCAEACPSGALSFEDEPTWEIKGGWNNAGHKAYFEDAVKCRTYWRQEAGTNCGICFAVCPFSKHDKAWIHTWVKGGISALPLLNSMWRSGDDAFGYGELATGESWWDLDEPSFGYDTTLMLQK